MRAIARTLVVLGCSLVVASAGSSSAQDDRDPASTAFKVWVGDALHPIESLELEAATDDLAAFGAAVGDARIVAVGDAVEGSAEPLQARNRLFRYLVENKGFTTIVIESGILEGKLVDDFVSGGPGEFDRIMAEGITTGFHEYTGNRDLIRWMREWNAAPDRTHKLRFFGFDISGSPLNRLGEGTVDGPLREALAFLEQVDPVAAGELKRRLDPLLPSLFWDLAGAMCVAQAGPWCIEVPEAERAALARQRQYFELDSDQRDRLTAAIADLVALIERNPLRYRDPNSAETYAWGLRAAHAAQQTDAFLRASVPIGWSPKDGRPMGGDEAQDGRSSAMVDNFEWILDQIGEDEKILVFATRFHIAGAPLTVGNGVEALPVGAELEERHGPDVVFVSTLASRGEAACGTQSVIPLPKPAPDTIDGMVASLGVPRFYVDLRTAPATLTDWLNQRQVLQAGGTLEMELADAFDILLYVGELSAACPIDPTAFRVPLPPEFADSPP